MTARILRSLDGLFQFPQPTRASFAVYYRHMLHFRYSWINSLFWICFEPAIYLLLLGFGLQQMIGQVNGHSYMSFLFPGLVVASSALVSFFESTHGTYTRIHQQRLIRGMSLAPLRPVDIVLGEIGWAATKGMFSAIFLMFLGSLMFDFNLVQGLGLFTITAITAWLFSAAGLYLTVSSSSFDLLFVCQTGIVLPMALVCNTYFPIESLPALLQKALLILPMTHSTMAARELFWGFADNSTIMSTGVLAALAFLLTNLAAHKINKTLMS